MNVASERRENRIGIRIILVSTLALLLWMAGTASSHAAAKAVPGNATGQIHAKHGTVLRAKASTSAKKVKKLKDNAKITVYYEVFTSKRNTASRYRWYYVKAGSKKGYVMTRRVDGIHYKAVLGRASRKVSYRVGPRTTMKSKGNLAKGRVVSVRLRARYRGSGQWWDKVRIGGKYRYVLSARMDRVSSSDFEAYLSAEGFPEAYKKKLRILHNEHPNWVFKAKQTNLTFDTVLSRETRDKVSLIYKSYPKSYRDKSSKSYKSGKYIAKEGSSWYNASKKVVAHYQDPRNFLNDKNIYMFLSLSYHSYQKDATVKKVLDGTELPKHGFNSSLFTGAGKKYGVSPIFLASRARQETGGGSIAIKGYKVKGKTVYNPYNIGATSGSNPVVKGLQYAYSKGWTTRKKAVYGGAQVISGSYIGKNQNTIYYQRFNVKNGWLMAGTHQYMTNITAPYTESLSMQKAYQAYGISEEKLVFEIPIYRSMPSSTKLP
ncbi:MAG: hypothetical protein Q4C18_06250 [Eubacteriales bacterium]|nr:hypothetical protein [Eubacteriales bacterium]